MSCLGSRSGHCETCYHNTAAHQVNWQVVVLFLYWPAAVR